MAILTGGEVAERLERWMNAEIPADHIERWARRARLEATPESEAVSQVLDRLQSVGGLTLDDVEALQSAARHRDGVEALKEHFAGPRRSGGSRIPLAVAYDPALVKKAGAQLEILHRQRRRYHRFMAAGLVLGIAVGALLAPLGLADSVADSLYIGTMLALALAYGAGVVAGRSPPVECPFCGEDWVTAHHGHWSELSRGFCPHCRCRVLARFSRGIRFRAAR